MLLQSLLIGLIAVIGYFDDFTGASMIARPIVTGPLVGLVMGDLQQGIIIGGSLELIWMGIVSVGAAVPPDIITGGVLGTALAISSHSGVQVALGLAVPIAMLAQFAKNAVYILRAGLIHKADKLADEGNIEGVERLHLFAFLCVIIPMGIINMLGMYFGSSVMKNILSFIPQGIMDGLASATGLLPALGVALLAQMIATKKILPYFGIGVVLAAYLKLPMMAIAVLGFMMAILIAQFDGGIKKEVAANEDDF